MGRMHLSLSLSEEMTQDTLEIGQDTRYLTMENTVRACIVFTRQVRAMQKETAQKVASIQQPTQGNRKSTELYAARVSAEYQAFFNYVQALSIQHTEGTLLNKQNRVRD